MAFPHSLSTKEMAEYVALYSSYELAVAEEAAEDYELPELPQVIFYAMLLKKAERLGVLHGQALRTLESALTELHWSTFESLVWLYGDWIFEARFPTKMTPEESSGANPKEESSDVELEGEGSASIHPSRGSGITGEEGKQRMLSTPISPFIMAFPPPYDTREIADYVRKSFIWC
ncbi:hypothetical protein Cgig2_009978 [Carnegiea gigantea]|uniref:Uncharacterized protein n=1 Tax=Carnegiea gigantea TaxID=171969 RepID=A0A9Q1JPU1_9CARY|nr:hypothetical protein Cgig2_009978 [Carnegiea gigantea]